MPLFFTPDQANDLLPEIGKTMAQIMEIKRTSEKFSDDAEIVDAAERLQREMQKLEDLGCVLKDLNLGLIDFPAVRLGTRVWLCWQSGERKVEFWHSLREGFSGRKPVKEDEFYLDDLAVRAIVGEVTKPAQ